MPAMIVRIKNVEYSSHTDQNRAADSIGAMVFAMDIER